MFTCPRIVADRIARQTMNAHDRIESIRISDTLRQRFVIMPAVGRNRANSQHCPRKRKSYTPIREPDLDQYYFALAYRIGQFGDNATRHAFPQGCKCAETCRYAIDTNRNR